MAMPTSTNEVTVRKLAATIQALWNKIVTALGGKADKVTNATNGNFAGLDANGNLIDSGHKHSDYATADQGTAASTAVQSVKINSGTELKNGNSVNVPLASTSADGAMSSTDKTKLNGIAAGAQENVIETIKRNGTALPVTDKAVDISVPTASSTTPKKDGTASTGSEASFARGDHVHPTDTSREAAANKKTTLNASSDTEFPTSKAVATYVNSSIATNTANFIDTLSLEDLGLSYGATNAQIASALGSHTWPEGVTPTNNDYAFISVNNPETTDVDEYRRFKYDGSVWKYEYTLNNSSFTAAQWAAINSGLSGADKSAYDSHLNDTNNPHGVTKDQVGLGNVGNFKAVSTVASQGLSSTEKSNARSNIGAGTYSKPSGGIPKTDLASDVLTSLGKADTAVQDVSGKLDKTGDGKDVSVTFSEAGSRANISSTESLATLFGKIKKWFTDLGAMAFKSNVSDSDINGTISDSHIASASTWNGKAAGNHTHSVKINGSTKTIAAPGGSAVDLGTYLTAHQTVKQDGVTGATSNRYASCSTAAATAAKTADITSGTFSLETGAFVSVKFANKNTANNPTLNINGTGAKNIYINGGQITSGGNKAVLAGVCDFRYDGTQWHVIGNYDSNTTTYVRYDTASQGLSEAQKANARTNIGASPELTEMTDQEVNDIIEALT